LCKSFPGLEVYLIKNNKYGFVTCSIVVGREGLAADMMQRIASTCVGLLLNLSKRHACHKLPWHSSGPCWHSKVQPPSAVGSNYKTVNLAIDRDIDLYMCEILGDKYWEDGCKIGSWLKIKQ
jgi:hypothetical protein